MLKRFFALGAFVAVVLVGGRPALADAPASRAATLADVNRSAGKAVALGKRVLLRTTAGEIELVLFPKVAPRTVDQISRLVSSGFYDGTTFHRVIPGFVAQGGDPNSKTLPAGHPQIGTGDADRRIPDEHGNGLKHLPGSVAMAHSAMPNSASCQFYIAQNRLAFLDGGYTVFGHVVRGYDVVLKLAATEGPGARKTPDRMKRVVLK